MGAKLDFSDFIATVDADRLDFVTDLHNELTERGCKIEVKEAKSGYVVTYRKDKKAVANYVFRKKGLVARLYLDHVSSYMDMLEALPDGMVRAIQEAPPCKRLADSGACNPKCAMGYDIILRGQRLQRCRNSAFQFFVTGETEAQIRTLLLQEVKAYG